MNDEKYLCTGGCGRDLPARHLFLCIEHGHCLCFECKDAHDVAAHGAEALGAPAGEVLH